MKGFTHYIIGLAAASCFPQAVREAASGNPFPFLIGGLCGLLPDVLDFKAARFFARHDMEIAPDPLDPDMQMVADGLACAIRQAQKTRQTIRVRLRTVQTGADAWQHYRIRFDPQGSITASLGAVCTTGGRPLEERDPDESSAAVEPRLVIGYEARVEVTILDGPMLAFVPLPDGRIKIEFIPWHRAWSHSLVLAAAAGLLLALTSSPLMGAIAALGWASHVMADQLGFLGSAMFYPFIAKRYTGLQLFRSMEAAPNLSLVWMSGLLILWNLARFASPALPLNGARLLILGGIIPLGLLAIWKKKSSA
jgi:hypothetical protein